MNTLIRNIRNILFVLILSSFSINAQNALNFDGFDDFIQTSYPGISATGQRSVEAWIKTPFVTGEEVITDWGTLTNGGRFTFALIDGKIRVEIHGSGVTSTTLVGDNIWHHVVVTYNNSSSPKFNVYLDGALENSFNIAGTMNTGSTINMRIGQRIDGAKGFNGNIDEVRVWDYDLSLTEIQNNMNSEFCTVQPGLIAYYKFNQGIAGGNNSGLTTLIDESGNGYNGTLNSFALTGSASNWITGYPLNVPATYESLNVGVCNSYTSPSGNYTWTSSGTYMDTIPNAEGCDSVITINLSINSTYDTIIEIACDIYNSPSGHYFWITSGIYQDTIPNTVGCDSILTINLTVNRTSYTNIFLSGCDSLVSPSGNHIWTASGQYQDTIPNATGCDSVMIIFLSIGHSSSAGISLETCDNYISPSGKYIWTVSGIYSDTIPNATGCDSLLTIQLTISENSNASVNISSCSSYTSPSGKYTWTTSGIYQDTILNTLGCDSILTINLTIGNNSTDTIIASTCGFYISPSGNYTWTTSGTYKDTIPNASGCDSVITVHLTLINSFSTIQVSACDSFISPSGNQTWTSSGTYLDTIMNSVGCDSIITVLLNITGVSYGNLNAQTCYYYVSPSGNFTWTSSGLYYDTITNTTGCDSVISVNLLVLQNSFYSFSASDCFYYVSPSGKYTWTSTGIYNDTIPNTIGCDSILTVDLTVVGITINSIIVSACSSFTSPSGNYIWTQSGVYKDTVLGSSGCDSIITINLSINNSYHSFLVFNCESYTSPSGKYTWTTSGTYQDTITNTAGCDSILTINLTIGNNSTNSINTNTCDYYVSPSGNHIWTATGTYLDTITNAAGCDSVIRVNLTVDTVETGVSQNGNNLSSQAIGASYQWLDCNKGMSIITGETNQNFSPSVSGSYAVEVTQNKCVDTSACINMVIIGFPEFSNVKIMVLPNPTTGRIGVDMSGYKKEVTITLINNVGEILHTVTHIESNPVYFDIDHPSGIYFVRITAEDFDKTFTIFKE
jgi:Concanavalin A-like lectin/glucanases superfamily